MAPGLVMSCMMYPWLECWWSTDVSCLTGHCHHVTQGGVNFSSMWNIINWYQIHLSGLKIDSIRSHFTRLQPVWPPLTRFDPFSVFAPLSVHPSVHLSIHPFVHLSVHNLSIAFTICLSILSVPLFVCLSIPLSVCYVICPCVLPWMWCCRHVFWKFVIHANGGGVTGTRTM